MNNLRNCVEMYAMRAHHNWDIDDDTRRRPVKVSTSRLELTIEVATSRWAMYGRKDSVVTITCAGSPRTFAVLSVEELWELYSALRTKYGAPNGAESAAMVMALFNDAGYPRQYIDIPDYDAKVHADSTAECGLLDEQGEDTNVGEARVVVLGFRPEEPQEGVQEGPTCTNTEYVIDDDNVRDAADM